MAFWARCLHSQPLSDGTTRSISCATAYLTTQSNVIAAVEQGSESIEAVYQWLAAELSPFFTAESATFAFGGYVWYLQKEKVG